LVEAAKPLKRDVPIVAEGIAQTEATANVEVRARVEATVEKILFVEGSEVKASDPLFLLEKEPIEQRLAAVKGNLGQLEASLGRANQDVARLTPLAKSGAVPQKDLDTAQALQKQAEAALDTGKAQLSAAELDLSYADVSAPVAGIIWANVEVSEVAYLNSAGKMKDPNNSPTFALVLANGQVHPHLGKLVFVDRMVDATTSTLKIRVEFPNPEKILRPGQFCRVRVLTRTLQGALLIPQRAVQEIQGLHNVYVVAADGKASYRRVKMSRRIGSLWVVESGLTDGEQVIIEGLQKAKDGEPVEVKEVQIDDAPLLELLSNVPRAAPTEKK
jgi:membrane fusion protein (multidrug efflux system)